MRNKIDILKGIQPGKVIARDLSKRNFSQRSFAALIHVPYQTLNAILKGRRHLTVEQALTIERALGYEEGFLLTLQVYHSIRVFKEEEARESVSGTPNIRRCLFWDTNFDTLDWGRYKDSVIQRVLERGNDSEREEIARFYGLEGIEWCRYKASNSYKTKMVD